MPCDFGSGVVLWLIVVILGAVLVYCHSAVWHIIRCHHACSSALFEFRQLVDGIQDTLLRVNGGLVQVHERYLILHRDAKRPLPKRARDHPVGPTEHGLSAAICWISSAIATDGSTGDLYLSEDQTGKLREALALVQQVRDSCIPGADHLWPPARAVAID